MTIQVRSLNKKQIVDFAFERNELLTSVKAEWVMFLDSDEQLSSPFSGKIEEQIKADSFSGYKILRKNYFLGKYIGSEYILRLGKKDAGKWQRAVHEKWLVKGKIGTIDKPFIIHNTAQNLHDYIGKLNLYSSLHAKENKKEGKISTLGKIVFYPLAKFIQTYIKSGNVVFSIMQSFHSFLGWSKEWEEYG